MWSYNNIDELYHYGVKGMKWRKRKKKYDKYGDLGFNTRVYLKTRDGARLANKMERYEDVPGDMKNKYPDSAPTIGERNYNAKRRAEQYKRNKKTAKLKTRLKRAMNTVIDPDARGIRSIESRIRKGNKKIAKLNSKLNTAVLPSEKRERIKTEIDRTKKDNDLEARVLKFAKRYKVVYDNKRKNRGHIEQKTASEWR